MLHHNNVEFGRITLPFMEQFLARLHDYKVWYTSQLLMQQNYKKTLHCGTYNTVCFLYLFIAYTIFSIYIKIRRFLQKHLVLQIYLMHTHGTFFCRPIGWIKCGFGVWEPDGTKTIVYHFLVLQKPLYPMLQSQDSITYKNSWDQQALSPYSPRKMLLIALRQMVG